MATWTGTRTRCRLLVASVAETLRAIRSGDGGVPFWFGSLFGGTLIIIGTFALTWKPWLSFSMTAIGCLAVANATMCTLILPLPRPRSSYWRACKPSTGADQGAPTFVGRAGGHAHARRHRCNRESMYKDS
jgi:hypothetical protein